MRIFITLLILTALTNSAHAQKAVLIEETPPIPEGRTQDVPFNPGRVTHKVEETKRGSFLTETTPFGDLMRGGDFPDAESLRRERRVGVGAETFGRLGMVGLDLELNFGSLDSAIVGMGGGPGYNSVSMGAKHLFGGRSLSPYASFSYARWSGSSHTRLDGTSPSYLQDKFLTESESQSGQFGKNFAVPAVGLQINQLKGHSAGGVLFAEVVGMLELSSGQFVPTGALGALFYF